MATHDYIISNASGAAVRADLNNALAAIASNNSAATEPTTTYAYQWWADTGSSPTVMKLRNAANSAWITLFQLDGEWSLIPFENGTAAAPSIYFKDSGTDTGLFSGGTDQVNVTTGGVERVEWGASEVVFNDGGENYDFRIESDTNANIFFVDASANAVGIGTADPGSYFSDARNLVIESGTDAGITIRSSTTTKGTIAFADGTTGADAYRGYVAYSHSDNSLAFATNGTEAVKIDSSRRLLVGTSTALTGANTPSAKLQIIGNTSAATDRGAQICLGHSAGAASIDQFDLLGSIHFTDNAAGEFARIEAYGDGAAGTNDYPGRLVFSTTADGASSPTERMRIGNNGQLSAVVPGGSTMYPGFMARAWVNFNGTGTIAIRASGNVSSLTDSGTGSYGVNLTTAMPDSNFAVAATGVDTGVNFALVSCQPNSTSQVEVGTFRVTAISTLSDISNISVSVFR